MALAYQRIDIKTVSGAIINLPLDYSKTALSGNDFITDSYIQSLKPGVVVYMAQEGYIKPAGAAATDVCLGFLVNDAAGYANQNVNANVSGLGAVLVGNGNQFVTDNVTETDIKPGDALYAGTDGILTKTRGTNTTKVAVALSGNSASDKGILVLTLI